MSRHVVRLVALLVLALAATACRSPFATGPRARTVISHRSGLPVSAEFDVDGDLQVFHVSATAWCEESDRMLAIDVLVDGVLVATQSLFSNTARVHRRLAGAAVPMRLAEGRHTIELRAGNDWTETDDLDRFDVVLVER